MVNELVVHVNKLTTKKIIITTMNNSKSEIICVDAVVRGTIITALPGAVVVDPANAYLLGSPIGDLGSISTSLDEKTKALSIMGERFSAHDSLVLLRHSFAIPKLHYLLRTTPCFLSGHLEEYDSVLRSILSSVTNCPLVQDEKAWLQASLPMQLHQI